MKELHCSEFELVLDGLAILLVEGVQYKYMTALEYDDARSKSMRVFSNAPEVFPLHQEKLFSDATLLQKVSLGEPFLAVSEDQIKMNFPDHSRIFDLGCGSLMNLPITMRGVVVGQVNLLHEAHFYNADKLSYALELLDTKLRGGQKVSRHKSLLIGERHNV